MSENKFVTPHLPSDVKSAYCSVCITGLAGGEVALRDQLTMEIQAYEAKKEKLEATCQGRWVVFHNGELFGDYASFSDAALTAERSFAKDDIFLIRQVGAVAPRMPAALALSGTAQPRAQR